MRLGWYCSGLEEEDYVLSSSYGRQSGVRVKVDLGTNVLFSKICMCCIGIGGLWLFLWIISNGGWMPLGLFSIGMGMFVIITAVQHSGEKRIK